MQTTKSKKSSRCPVSQFTFDPFCSQNNNIHLLHRTLSSSQLQAIHHALLVDTNLLPWKTDDCAPDFAILQFRLGSCDFGKGYALGNVGLDLVPFE